VHYLWRFYSVSVLNTAFGFGLYALLVWLGLNLYIAQIVSHLCGMTFNFFTYRTHVFRGLRPSVPAYIAAYASNYLVGLTLLAIFHHLTRSAYLAGFLATVIASLINFAVLKLLVFRRAAKAG
jgi:putative flippase GtrA